MKRLFLAIAALVGIWLLGSFVGTMFDPARANLWTTSLMWALLSCVVLAPIVLFLSTSNSDDAFSSSGPAEQPFEVQNSVDVPDEQEESEKEDWPYTSE